MNTNGSMNSDDNEARVASANYLACCPLDQLRFKSQRMLYKHCICVF